MSGDPAQQPPPPTPAAFEPQLARPAPPTYFLTRALVVRGLGAVFLIAFLSLWGQLPGLYGPRGIVPIADTVEAWTAHLAARGVTSTPGRLAAIPSLVWFCPSLTGLRGLCDVGAAAAGLACAGVAVRWMLLVCWACYLSVTLAGAPFTNFQWDTLLLEAGLIGALWAPGNLWPALHRERPPSATGLWLHRWLLLRLMVTSGAVKILSNDGTWLAHERGRPFGIGALLSGDGPVGWADLLKPGTALEYHYFTQPLPNPLSWYAHHLPAALQRWSVGTMFVIELILPWAIFLPRRCRIVACAGLLALQCLIALTGNYTFFNLLTALLCVVLLDDGLLRRILPRTAGAVLSRRVAPRPRRVGQRLRSAVLVLIGVFIATVGGLNMVQRLGWQPALPAGVTRVVAAVAPFRSINSYGLFAGMTTRRPELIIEGSDDLRTWIPYAFPHKPGDPRRRPTQIAPHQPRLDWQMWFAALTVQRPGRGVDRWLVRLVDRLLEGSPEVLALLDENPFPTGSPSAVRVVLYDYTFSTAAQRAESGAWWQRSAQRVVFTRTRH